MPNEPFSTYIMARASYISRRWWCPVCTRPKRL